MRTEYILNTTWTAVPLCLRCDKNVSPEERIATTPICQECADLLFKPVWSQHNYGTFTDVNS